MKIITAYMNNTGKIFLNAEDCAKSENLIKCKICNGTGIERYEHVETIPGGYGIHDNAWVDDKIIVTTRNKECSRCEGLGYVKENIEDNLEYQKYLELKSKFEKA